MGQTEKVALMARQRGDSRPPGGGSEEPGSVQEQGGVSLWAFS